jgi:hypothetical protein
MQKLRDDQIKRVKDFIYQNGRLLERTLFSYFFEDGSKETCINALKAYQNNDGGFGNGIEPDLLCPQSTAIGAETAMFILDLLDYRESEIINPLVEWISSNQNKKGFIPHPPKYFRDYPHQPWWVNPDNDRILVLAGYLKKWGITHPGIFSKVRSYYQRVGLPDEVNFFSYPYFVYLQYCGETIQDKAELNRFSEQLPVILKEHRAHYPLFSRYWFHAADYVEQEVLNLEAKAFLNAIQRDGGVENPYPDLPWWRPIFTLDGLLLLKTSSFI